MTTFDPALEAWLKSLGSLGYPRDWVRNNMTVLVERFHKNGGAEMPRCPDPTPEPYDPYKGL
ncbi:hypothetical protein [Novosphingobium pentaromativorans]|nr:hypothetical protein [Novosphingobium pentaromativorans]